MTRLLALSLLTLLTSCSGGSQPEHAGDVILITVDALRADFISHENTPTLARLAAEGLSFTNARANSSHPLQSSATLLTGLLPTRGGSIGLLEAAPSEEAEALGEDFAASQDIAPIRMAWALMGANSRFTILVASGIAALLGLLLAALARRTAAIVLSAVGGGLLVIVLALFFAKKKAVTNKEAWVSSLEPEKAA